MKKKGMFLRCIVLLVGIIVLSAAGYPTSDLKDPNSEPKVATLTFSSTSFADEAEIPVLHRFANSAQPGASPQLSWSNVPAGTTELVLIVHDSLAVANNWVHWVLYDIPPTLTSIPVGMNVTKTATAKKITYNGSEISQGFNNYATSILTVGHRGYDGPYVSAPTGRHLYHFTLYALNAEFALPNLFTIAAPTPGYYSALTAAVEGKIIQQSSFTGYMLRP